MSRPCEIEDQIRLAGEQLCAPPSPTRRRFLQRSLASAAGLTCADFLGASRGCLARVPTRVRAVWRVSRGVCR